MKYSFIEYLFVYLRCEVINMVVVVLKAATSFAGIDYNERKNEEGKSELLVAENFAMNPDNLKKSDYIAYMESVCRTNPAVKAKQFHAVISCKGREYSAEDLKNVALQYINKMGYGNNPYMIYVNSTLAVSNIRNRTYTNCEVYLIDYGYGNFKEKIHFME